MGLHIDINVRFQATSLYVMYHASAYFSAYIEGILPKGPYLPCVSMAGRALLAGYHRYMGTLKVIKCSLAASQRSWRHAMETLTA